MVFNFLSDLTFLLCLVSFGYYLYAIYAVIRFFSLTSEIDLTFCPSVTILKPLCGLETEMYDTLASFCQQDYPVYQIIFTVQKINDPSVAIVQQLKQDFPQVDIQLIISDRCLGHNLKISNLANGINRAKYDILIFSDSDIKVSSDYLKTIIQPLKNDNVGIVTCLYRSKTTNFIAAFEAIGVTTHFHPSVFVAYFVEGIRYGFGSTIVIRKSVLESIGGLMSVANCLADDYKLVNLAYQKGYQVSLSSYIVEHSLNTQTWSELIQHQSRWFKCIRVERCWSYWGLLITYGVVFGFLFLILSKASLISYVLLIIFLITRLFLAWLVGIYYFQDQGVKQWFFFIPFRDFLGILIWFYGLFSNTVIWRGERFKLLKNGQMIPQDHLSSC